MAPEYARAATILREKKPQVLLAKIDTTVQQALSNRFDVNKYPTLFISHRGKMTEYEGTFSAEGQHSFFFFLLEDKKRDHSLCRLSIRKQRFNMLQNSYSHNRVNLTKQ